LLFLQYYTWLIFLIFSHLLIFDITLLNLSKIILATSHIEKQKKINVNKLPTNIQKIINIK